MASLEELLAASGKGTPEGAAWQGLLKELPAGAGYFGMADYLGRQEDQNRVRGKIAQQDESMAVIKDVLQRAGGNPEAAIQALLATGDPIGVEMAAKLKAFAPKPAEPFTLGEGQVRFGPDGKRIVAGSPKTDTSQPELLELTGRLEKLPQGHPSRPMIEARIKQLTSRADQSIPVTVTEIDHPTDPKKKLKIDARTGKVIGVITKDALTKPLPGPLQKQLTEASEMADASSRFTQTFKDEFGGKTITGELSNVTGRYLGDPTGQAQWWQDYELYQSQVRNKLFGSALTAPEIAAWNKSAVNPRMDSTEIRKNLKRRNELEQTAIDRLMKGAAVTYSPEQIEAFTGRSVGGTTRPQVSPYVEIRTTPSGKKLGKKADGTIEEIK